MKAPDGQWPPNESCSNCKFWKINFKHGERYDGFCRRYPPDKIEPQQRNSDLDGVEWQHTITWEDDWCGDHKQVPWSWIPEKSDE